MPKKKHVLQLVSVDLFGDFGDSETARTASNPGFYTDQLQGNFNAMSMKHISDVDTLDE